MQRVLKFVAPKAFQNTYKTKAVLSTVERYVEVGICLGRSSLEDSPDNREVLESLNIQYAIS